MSARVERIIDRFCRLVLGAGMSAIAFVIEKQVERMTAKEADEKAKA